MQNGQRTWIAHHSDPQRAIGNGTILLVEDCPLASRALARDLARLGLLPVVATTPLEAIHALTKTQGAFGAALVDFHLGCAEGTELLDYLREEHPLVRRVFFSGDHEACERERLQPLERSHCVVDKPWTLISLSHALGLHRT